MQGLQESLLILKCSSKHNPTWISWKIESLECSTTLPLLLQLFLLLCKQSFHFRQMPQYDSLSLAFSSSKPYVHSQHLSEYSTLKCTPLKHQSFLKCIKAFLPPLQPKTKCTKPLIFLDTTLPLIRSLFCGQSSFGSKKFFAFARLGSISCHDDELVFFFLHDDKGVRTLLSLLLGPFFTRRPRLDWSFEANFSHLRSSQKFCRTKSEIIFFLKGQTVLLHFVIRSRLYVHSTLIDYCRI